MTATVETFGDEWCGIVADLGGSLGPVEGADLVIDHVISGAPGGKRRFTISWVSGVVDQCRPGRAEQVDVTVEAKYPDAVALLSGDLDADVAFMQGRLKMDGAYERLVFELHDWRAATVYRDFWSAIAARSSL